MSVVAEIRNLIARPARSRRGGMVGVDIGTAAIKIVQTESRGRSVRVTRSTLIPRPVLSQSEGQTDPSIGLPELLKAHLGTSSAFAGESAACVLSMSATPIQTLDLPAANRHEQRSMALVELADDAGGRALSLDCWPAPGAGKEGLFPVYVMSVPEEIATNAAEHLWNVGLRTHVLDGLPFVLARAARIARPGEAGPIAVLDWGVSTATFVVARDGQPIYTRVFRNCGFRAVQHAVVNGFGVSLEDAQRLLSEYGLPDATAISARRMEVQTMVQDLCAAALHRLCDEIIRTMSYLKTQGSALAASRILLLGGGGTLANVARWLSETSETTVERWSLPEAGDTAASSLPLWGAAISLSMLGSNA
ncbi:MAG: pilus assembly protein PilM [Planctomycetaceae bacterium]|nr:pilus assembly protein PilM [Planctomycetaceae bacterium]